MQKEQHTKLWRVACDSHSHAQRRKRLYFHVSGDVFSAVFFLSFLYFRKVHCILWEIQVALPGSGYGSHKSSITHSYLSVCAVFLCVQTMAHSCRCWGFFNMRKDGNACSCTQWLTNTGGESALKVDSRRNVPCHTGWALEPPSLLCQAFQSDGLPSSQLSHSILMFAIM